MRSPAFSTALVVSVALVTILYTACTQQQARTVLNGALTAAQIACALERSMLGDEAIAQACEIRGDLAPVLRALIGSHRAAAKRENAASAPMIPDRRCP